ncbi:MAG: histidinol dehydrogenase [Acidimicrobiales bacterium]|nr:histidinol dehydrogenase [Acidimicrobiales bacterium]MDP6299310.1 histidinol dehydrogenase [Acidimicrobiales bacterium]HJM28296.1 histidinol dehydrogenase [Acidimicrobiales bacterium]HJM98547.1 histidinol dehydrogenase [Acidimicrobiales bacterium]
MLTRLNLTGIHPKRLSEELPRPIQLEDDTESVVSSIINDVKLNGDSALRAYAEKFDGGAPESFLVSEEDVEEAIMNCSQDLKSALSDAALRIRTFHKSQIREKKNFELDGISVQTIHQPVLRAGCYVPGGRAAYPSTLLMTAIPAMVAGVEEVIVCAPPNKSGRIDQATLVAARIAGVSNIYMVGGAQAIAAMAYGTKSIDPVDVIVGPGNVYVATAKKLVSGDVGIAAAFAGPSEIVVVADDTVDPKLAAIDLIVQAEHGPGGMSWLISWSDEVIESILNEVSILAEESPRLEDIRSTFETGGYAVLVDGPEQAMDVSNYVAPEHLQLMLEEPSQCLKKIRNAGAVFVGEMSPAVVGDYVAGPSHVLPTDSTARFASALTVDDFLKDIHIVEMDQEALTGVADTITTIAEAESLNAHALSVRLRIEGEK